MTLAVAKALSPNKQSSPYKARLSQISNDKITLAHEHEEAS